MEDGTVEYIQVFEDLTNWNTLSNDQKMNSRGKIAGVNDVVMLFPMSVTSFSGYVSVGAERKDGSFYDLTEFNL